MVFREKLGKNNGIIVLFEEFETVLKELGFFEKSWQIVDVSIISALIRRSGKRDNELIKNGKNLKIETTGQILKNLKLISISDLHINLKK